MAQFWGAPPMALLGPARTGPTPLQALALGLYPVLVAAWITVAARTVHGSIRGFLFLPGAPPPDSR